MKSAVDGYVKKHEGSLYKQGVEASEHPRKSVSSYPVSSKATLVAQLELLKLVIA